MIAYVRDGTLVALSSEAVSAIFLIQVRKRKGRKDGGN